MSRTKNIHSSTKKNHLAAQSLYDILYGLILIAYIAVPTFTPNWMALDTNAPKFLTTAILNLAVFGIFIFTRFFQRHPEFTPDFFSNPIGVVYTGLLVVSLLSFTQAITVEESLVHFAKVFTVFASVFNISMLLMYDLKFIRLIILAFTGLLIFDAISVFVDIGRFIDGEIKAITDIKTIYSNKNILASAIFVKLAFAIYLLVFEKGWKRWLGWVALTMGVTATFFMATRAFYLGLSLLSLVFITYYLMVYIRKRNLKYLILSGSYLLAILIAYGIFTYTQSELYPKGKKTDRHMQGVVEQIASLADPETGSRIRANAYKWSLRLIQENPLLGVGLGNWKITILKYENQESVHYRYIYKAHNDFLEVTAETGIPGGLLFTGIFLLILWNFLRRFHKDPEGSDPVSKYLFVAAAGISFYGVDAMFNFPHDRPEITALFAFFVAIGMVASRPVIIQEKPGWLSTRVSTLLSRQAVLVILTVFHIAFMAVSVWLLYLNFLSSKTQRIVYEEILASKIQAPAEKIIQGLPRIPVISIWGESIANLKARYLYRDEKYQDVIEILRPERSNPFDARREYFMAMSFYKLGEYDSAQYYAEQVYRLKPYYFRNLKSLGALYEIKGEPMKIAEAYDNYLARNKKDTEAWIEISNFYLRHGDTTRALNIINEASQFRPHNKKIEQQRKYIHHKVFIEPYMHLMDKATDLFYKKKYANAISLLDEFIQHAPDFPPPYNLRAYCHYYLKNYSKVISNADQAERLGMQTGALVNLRGIAYLELKEMEKACADFKKAMQLGDPSGKSNFEKFCENQSTK